MNEDLHLPDSSLPDTAFAARRLSKLRRDEGQPKKCASERRGSRVRVGYPATAAWKPSNKSPTGEFATGRATGRSTSQPIPDRPQKRRQGQPASGEPGPTAGIAVPAALRR